jgi:hypothetical protein
LERRRNKRVGASMFSVMSSALGFVGRMLVGCVRVGVVVVVGEREREQGRRKKKDMKV